MLQQARKEAITPRPGWEHSSAPTEKRSIEKGYRRSKKISFLLLCGCFLFGLVIIAQYSSIVTLNYRLSRAEARLIALDEEYCALEQRAAQLSSLSRIESIARTELGMREPENGQLVVLTAVREKGLSMGE